MVLSFALTKTYSWLSLWWEFDKFINNGSICSAQTIPPYAKKQCPDGFGLDRNYCVR